jgi:peptidoglycan/LPS O-acetylase OafA/YrhL
VTAHAPALDGIRGVAILLVLFHHFTILTPDSSASAALSRAAALGWAGVDLFFVLSGFLITGILIAARGRRRYFSSFYARRTLRIVPLYYLVVFASLIVLPWSPALYDVLAGPGAPREQLPYWLYLTNFAVAERGAFLHGILDVAWSLAIEEQFYVVWAAVVWLLAPRLLGLTCVAIVVAAPLARNVALANGSPPIDLYVLTPYRADALVAGALLAWLFARGHLEGGRRAAPAIVALALSGLAAVCWIDGEGWWWGPAMQRVGYSLLAVGGAGLIAAAILHGQGTWARALSTGWLRAFGKYSYCLYLIHLPVMRLVRTYVLPPERFDAFGSVVGGQFAFYLLTAGPAFGLAWLSWRYVEAPILRLKRFFPY